MVFAKINLVRIKSMGLGKLRQMTMH